MKECQSFACPVFPKLGGRRYVGFQKALSFGNLSWLHGSPLLCLVAELLPPSQAVSSSDIPELPAPLVLLLLMHFPRVD